MPLLHEDNSLPWLTSAPEDLGVVIEVLVCHGFLTMLEPGPLNSANSRGEHTGLKAF